MHERDFYTYIITNKRNGTLYVGVTNNLERRMFEHKQRLHDGFAKRYGLDRLVYFEHTDSITDAIYREKQIKSWLRIKKLQLIEIENPQWIDLSKDWDMDFVLDYPPHRL